MESIIVNQPIVIDNGSGIIKAGFAGDQIPKCYFPNYVGRPKHVRVMAGALEGDIFIGPKAEEHRGLMNIKYPMEHGIVNDWNDMERIWQYIFSKRPTTNCFRRTSYIIDRGATKSSKKQGKSCRNFFETFNVPALFISMQAVLSLYSSGRTTGVVVDSGDGVTHVVPIYEGFAMPHSILRSEIAGRDITRYLRQLLRKEGLNFHTTSEMEVVKHIKEKVCYLAMSPHQEEKVKSVKAEYALPDGSIIEVGPSRYRGPELLFKPELCGEEYPGVHELLVYSIHKSDLDLRKLLYQNIVLSGGSTLFKGFGERLLNEIKTMAPKDVKIRKYVFYSNRYPLPKERLYSTWIGGSILASLDTFKKIWITKREYVNEGERILLKKTF